MITPTTTADVTDRCLPYFTPYVKIESVLRNYKNCSYVGQFPLKSNGEHVLFLDWAVDVFYNPEPRIDLGHSNYFAIYFKEDRPYITNAKHVCDMVFRGIEDSEGNIIYSRYRHDFRANKDGVCVDGGSWSIYRENDDSFYEMLGRVVGFDSTTISHKLKNN